MRNLIKCRYVINDSDKCIIICLYIDDMFILSSNIGTIDETNKIPAFDFDMKDMGEANVVLGIKITKVSDSLML